MALLSFGFLFFGFFWLVNSVGNTKSSSANADSALASVDSDRVVSLDTYCSDSEVSVLQAYRAISEHDIKGVLGMVDRHEISALEKGDKAHVYMTSGKLSRIRLTSGYKLGQHCWIASGMLE
jgi:hypothetical protein